MFEKFVKTVDPYEVVGCGLDSFSPYSYCDWSKVRELYPDLWKEIESLSKEDREKFDDRVCEWVDYDLPNGV